MGSSQLTSFEDSAQLIQNIDVEVAILNELRLEHPYGTPGRGLEKQYI
jgi:hypothetical protein